MAKMSRCTLHVTEPEGKAAFAALESAATARAGVAGPDVSLKTLDPETAARRILAKALADDATKALQSIAAPSVAGKEAEFRPISTETVALTGTKVVKFRQYYDRIPVYSSLVAVELDENNECVSLDTTIGEPKGVGLVAKISPAQALGRVARESGQKAPAITAAPRLHFYLDRKGKWHLAYIFENVVKKTKARITRRPVAKIADYVIDAMTGSVIAELPRIPTVTMTGIDELEVSRSFEVTPRGTGSHVMIDETMGVETYDFDFADPIREADKLPGRLIAKPPEFSRAAVSAHANASEVARFLREVLKRNSIDDRGGRLISSINCVDASEAQPGNQWFNAFWEGTQMVYGQVDFNGMLRSLAASMDVVAHEIFHGVTDKSSRLEYVGETGALNESYSDIFGTIISNAAILSIEDWNWEIGDGLSSARAAFRDMKDPTRYGQPKHMDDFVRTSRDHGGVHINSGIHNYAAYRIMTAHSAGSLVFTAPDIAAIFYLSLTLHLTRQSKFADSRRGVVLAARSLFRSDEPAVLARKIAAIERGFSAAGIK